MNNKIIENAPFGEQLNTLYEQIKEVLPHMLCTSFNNAQLVLKEISGIELNLEEFIEKQADASDDRYSNFSLIDQEYKNYGYLDEGYALLLAEELADHVISNGECQEQYREYLRKLN